MRLFICGIIIAALPVVAHAKIPFVNASCPTGIEVHADEGGPIYINGKQAKITSQNANYVEAREGHVTISMSINPDRSIDVSYTGQHGANGICQVSGASAGGTGACPVDVTEADRYKYPACN